MALDVAFILCLYFYAGQCEDFIGQHSLVQFQSLVQQY
jgi:hypothetical protein